ncbi:MarR family winged helix-turn-helix transcriptional regulator [Pelagibius sp. Alg239-R121]|uniref:MarR family winged helix-turn-helix transcriptional regulator n=1 Tax=Pelagibius sp. Alg239-R121 TaxID=2993448 RepID=UPI0024A65D16|nr:MarR family transcriptional regulator [Pelagibius sp. Alg239-R121]
MKVPTKLTVDALYDVIRQVRPLYKTLEASVALELAKTGITVSQRAILEQLLDHGAETVPAIGRRLMAPRQFIQKIANELITLGLIKRNENVAHKRSLLLSLTPEGNAMITRIKEREAEVMAPIAKTLNAADIETARSVMIAMTRAFSAHNAQAETLKDSKETI